MHQVIKSKFLFMKVGLGSTKMPNSIQSQQIRENCPIEKASRIKNIRAMLKAAFNWVVLKTITKHSSPKSKFYFKFSFSEVPNNQKTLNAKPKDNIVIGMDRGSYIS